jgi:hypothetical protein
VWVRRVAALKLSEGRSCLAVKATASVDAKSVLAKASKGRSIVMHHRNHIIFSQDEPADAVFYIPRKVRKRSLQFLVRTISSARVALPDRIVLSARSGVVSEAPRAAYRSKIENSSQRRDLSLFAAGHGSAADEALRHGRISKIGEHMLAVS